MTDYRVRLVDEHLTALERLAGPLGSAPALAVRGLVEHLAEDYDAVLKLNDELQREAGEPGEETMTSGGSA